MSTQGGCDPSIWEGGVGKGELTLSVVLCTHGTDRYLYECSPIPRLGGWLLYMRSGVLKAEGLNVGLLQLLKMVRRRGIGRT